MFTWLTAAADPRVAVAAPVMGVQAFGWALGAGAWGARVDSIPLVFEVAADDLAAAEKEKAKEKEQRQGGHAAPTGVAVGAEGVQGNGGGAADAASGRGKVGSARARCGVCVSEQTRCMHFVRIVCVYVGCSVP